MRLYEFYNDPESTFIFANSDLEACNLKASSFLGESSTTIDIMNYDRYSVLLIGTLYQGTFRFEFWSYEIKSGVVR